MCPFHLTESILKYSVIWISIEGEKKDISIIIFASVTELETVLNSCAIGDQNEIAKISETVFQVKVS